MDSNYLFNNKGMPVACCLLPNSHPLSFCVILTLIVLLQLIGMCVLTNVNQANQKC